MPTKVEISLDASDVHSEGQNRRAGRCAGKRVFRKESGSAEAVRSVFFFPTKIEISLDAEQYRKELSSLVLSVHSVY